MHAALAVGRVGIALVDGLGGDDGLELVELAGREAVNLLQGNESLLGEHEAVVLIHAAGIVAHGEVAAEHWR